MNFARCLATFALLAVTVVNGHDGPHIGPHGGPHEGHHDGTHEGHHEGHHDGIHGGHHGGPDGEMQGRDYEERPEMMMMMRGAEEPRGEDMMDSFKHGEREPRDGMMKKGMRGPGAGFFGGKEGGGKDPHHMWKKEEKEMDYVPMDCDVDTTPCTACHETEGFFVCRAFDKTHKHHHEMKLGEDEEIKEVSMCITAEKGLEGDMCGCCGGECPEACTLACEFEGKDGTMHEGVLIDLSYPSKVEEGVMEEKQMCIPESRSVSMLAYGKAANCAMEKIELREAE